jgi:hypothetical protein
MNDGQGARPRTLAIHAGSEQDAYLRTIGWRSTVKVKLSSAGEPTA